ncbi:predicted protein [Arabidopsis lyrata subsp. lyrata]|uniref:Predicted protein n=1 Tax=Arabidopsis lyrata subsp. lyrata TaxID=81972 RepID=D7KTR4_ARALL|nr:predicted protein [Arabidopsis lyrata subsp. lyrata]
MERNSLGDQAPIWMDWKRRLHSDGEDITGRSSFWASEALVGGRFEVSAMVSEFDGSDLRTK